MRKILSAFAALLAITACYNSNQQKAETAATTDGKAIVENIMTRTSIRQYTDQDISADTIETLLRAGMAAPTAVNKQPWHFVVFGITCFVEFGEQVHSTMPSPRFSAHCCSAEDGADN